MDIGFEEISSFLEKISTDYHMELDAVLSDDDKGCIKSSIVLTEIISKRYGLPIGFGSHGIRIKCGKVRDTHHFWNEVSLDGKIFLDARFGQFDDRYLKKIRFEKIYGGFYVNQKFHGITVYDDKNLSEFFAGLAYVDDNDTAVFALSLSPYPENADFMLKINDSGSTDTYLTQARYQDLKRITEMFISY